MGNRESSQLMSPTAQQVVGNTEDHVMSQPSPPPPPPPPRLRLRPPPLTSSSSASPLSSLNGPSRSLGSLGSEASLGDYRSLGSSLSSLGIALAAFAAPLAELDEEADQASPMSEPASSTSSTSTSSAASAAAAAAAVAATRPRIHPILRGGRQLSTDLYWVLPPRAAAKKRRRRVQTLSPTSPTPPTPTYVPGQTPMDLVRSVTEQVFGVTDEESYVALSLHRWDSEAATRYLKVEQLFRLGLADRNACRDLLAAHGWRLESACSAYLS